jgi:hypothetical protein
MNYNHDKTGSKNRFQKWLLIDPVPVLLLKYLFVFSQSWNRFSPVGDMPIFLFGIGTGS